MSIKTITWQTIFQFLDLDGDESSEPWVQAVRDRETIKVLLAKDRQHSRRKAYGLFHGPVMVGYAVIYQPDAHLELLYLSDFMRGQGKAKQFLDALAVRSASVNEQNSKAVKLYDSMGYELEFI